MYQAAIFDLDGTLANTLESIALPANKALESCKLKAQPVEDYRYYVGDGVQMLIRRVVKAAGDTTLLYMEEVLKAYQVFFETDCTYHVQPYNDILSLLQYLKTTGMKLAVVTNKPHDRAVTVVESLFGTEYFDFVLGQKEGLKRKPDPEGVLLAAKHFSLLPSECIYIGDTNTDMETGNRAGMFTIGVLWGFRNREELEASHAQSIVENPMDIAVLVKERCK